MQEIPKGAAEHVPCWKSSKASISGWPSPRAVSLTRVSDARHHGRVSPSVQSVEPSGPGDKRAQHRETTRASLFEAAISEFRRVGFAETEIAVVAEQVGVARGTFYVHFAGKDAVLVELLDTEERRIADRVSGAASRSP